MAYGCACYQNFCLILSSIERAHFYRLSSLPLLQHGRRGGPGNAKRHSGQTTGVQTEPPRTSPASLRLCGPSLLQRSRDFHVCRGPRARLPSLRDVFYRLSVDDLVLLFTGDQGASEVVLPSHAKSQYTRGECYCWADGMRPTTSYRQ